MKRLIILILPALLNAESFVEILKKVEKNTLLKSKRYEVLAYKKLKEAKKGENLFSIEASLQGIYLKDTPRMYLHLKIPGLNNSFQAASKEQYIGEISISYPLFSGFYITKNIQKAFLKEEKAKLELKDLKRKLYLQTAEIYSQIYSLQKSKSALKKALKAIDLSYKKAKGFFNQELIPKSDLYNIEAKKYEIETNLEEIESLTKSLYQKLSYLTNDKISLIGDLKKLIIPKKIDIKNRADIKALEKLLQIDQKDIEIAKSLYYPKIFLKAGLKGYGNNLNLNGDGYRNGDQSYASFVIKQNIFNGFSDKNKIEAAKYKKLAQTSYLNDYKREVKSQIKSDIFILKSLQAKLNWTKKQIKAAESYYKLTKGRFENQLSSADELSRAIANLAKAKANKAKIQADIFAQKCKILLQISLEEFEKELTGL